MTRREVLIEMLKRYEEAQTTLWKGSGRGDDSETRMPATWNGSYRELERCLVRLREERPRQYAHLHARYIDRAFERRELKVRTVRGSPKPLVPAHCELVAVQAKSISRPTVMARVAVWPGWVRLSVVDAGVSFLVEEFRGVPYLPLEFVAA